MCKATLFPLWFSSILLISCGGGSSRATLQSIKINQQIATDSSQFTATGFYSDGKQVTSFSAAWFQWTVGSFFIGNPHYSLTSSPFQPQCASGTALTIMAVAPIDPHAPSSGTMPMNVFQDFALQKTDNEGGFVAAIAQTTCT